VAEYVKGALNAPGSSAESRLLQLVARPQVRQLVDEGAARIAAPPNPSIAAVKLRLAVLDAQGRKTEIETFLSAIANGTDSLELLENIQALAEQRSLDAVRQHALERQASLTNDPINRMQIRYALVQFYEGRRDFNAAQQNIESLYRENPKILGVVRSTVDFYWRVRNYPRAISVLRQAAEDAYPDLRRQFTFEAARKATEAKDYAQARELLNELLKQMPYNAEYLAAMADTYAQAGDDQGVKQFYEGKIAALQHASVPTDVRNTQIAGLRRGLIPALTRLKQYPAAVDQYIELLNSFPEDAGLAVESALYAQRYGRQSQLVDFYATTVVQSPRDSRWSVVLARIQTALENYQGAIETYGKAIAVRPDRVDLYTARAGLEERLMPLDEAIADYEGLYQLAYKDPQWMEKVAELRARQGKSTEAVSALTAALLTGRPENPGDYGEVAQRLEGWGMLAEARDFAEHGVKLAGDDLLADARYHSIANTFVRIATRMRQQEGAYAALQRSLEAASSTLPVLKEQAAKQGISGISDTKWREQLRQNRIENANDGMSAALQEMGRAVNTFFTPEERLAFAQFAESKRVGMTIEQLQAFAIPLAQSAGLAEQEARWRFEWLLQRSATMPYQQQLQEFIRLQRGRTRYSELGGQLQRLAALLTTSGQNAFLYPAADAYRSAGDPAGELQVLSSIRPAFLDPERQERLFTLLLKSQPQALIQLGANWQEVASQRAADFVIANGDAALAHDLVQARGRSRQPVWTKSYSALVGLYFAEPTAAVNGSFLGSLGNLKVGERIGRPVDRAQQLAGNVWFYYGSRYGEYLGITNRGTPEDYLPSALEQSPATASGYLSLANYYADRGNSQRAIEEYDHTLDLASERPDVLNELASVYYKRGDRDAALDRWRAAYRVLAKQVDQPHPPETFWKDFGRTCDELRTRRIFASLQPEADAVIRSYLRKNGNYRSNALLQPAYAALNDPPAATTWLLDLSKAASDSTRVLVDVVNAPWIPVSSRAPIYQRILDSKRATLAKSTGLEHDYAQQDVDLWTVKWIQYLVRAKQYQQADEAIHQQSETTRTSQASAIIPLELTVAARLGGLDATLESYRSDPARAPDAAILRAAAKQLTDSGDAVSARKIMGFVFTRAIENQELTASNFLGLAELRLAEGNIDLALALLRRLTTVVGQPFENLESAAALLEKSGHNLEAIEFLAKLSDANPWQPAYRVRLAKAQLAAGHDPSATQKTLRKVASDPTSTYETRIQAASALVGNQENLGSAELNLLAGDTKHIQSEAADKFYFYEARMAAAMTASDLSARFALLTHCVIDFPRRSQARLPLFEAAIAIKSDEYALGAVQPILNANGTEVVDGRIAYEKQPDIENDVEGSSKSGALTDTLTAPESHGRARLEDSVGQLLVRLSRPRDALNHFQTARRMESSSSERAKLESRITAIQAWLRIQTQNADREPILHEALEQDRIVRPKLPVHALSTTLSAKGGSAQ
jgi:predicted Zn-dependent protease